METAELVDERFSSHAELFKALARAQAKYPRLVKDTTAKIQSNKGSYSYDYADLATVVSAIRPCLNAEGISVAQSAEMRDGMLVMTTALMHESGQCRSIVPWPLPVDVDARGMASMITYARRYSFMLATGCAAAEEDDDAAAVSEKPAQRPAFVPVTAKPDVEQPINLAPGSVVAEAAKTGAVLVQSVSDKDKYGAYHVAFTDGVSLKTKAALLMKKAGEFLAQRVPVTYTRWEQNEKWLGGVYPAGSVTAHEPEDSGAPLEVADIPFAWLLAMLIPALALVS